MAQLHLRKYGASATINFVLYGITGVDLKSDAAHATGDTKLMKDEGAEADTTNGFTDEGQGYAIVLTATEMQAARLVLYIVDTATKVWLDTAVIIETYGHASAQHPFDLSVVTQSVNVTQWNGTNVTTPDTAGSPKVTITAGTGAGQLDFASGVVKSNLVQILATALTETAGLLAGGFKKFFNVATPTGTLNSIPDAVAGASGGLFIAGSNAATTANITGNLTGNVSGSVGSVTGSVGSVTAGVTVTTNNDKTGYGLSAAAVQAIWDALTSALTTVGSIGKRLADNIDATISSRLASASYTTPPTAVEIRQEIDNNSTILDGIVTNQSTINNNVLQAITDIAVVESQTDDIGVAGAGLTAIPGVVTVTGNVNGSVGSVTGAVGSVTGNVGGSVASVTAGVTVTTNNDKTGYSLSVAGIQAIWDALTAALTTVGSIGKLLVDNVNGSMSAVLARLPAALTGAGNMKADALAVNGSTSAATQLARSAVTIVNAAAIAGTLSTTEMTTDLTEVTNDHYNGRIIIWTSGVLLNQATAITDYDGATKKLTYTAITEAPGAGDTFIIV